MAISRKFFAAALVAVVLGGCSGPPEYSTAPGKPAPADEQMRLVGVWSAQNTKLRNPAEATSEKNADRSNVSVALVLPAPDGRLSILFGHGGQKIEARMSENRKNWHVEVSAFWIRGRGHVAILAGQRYLVFRREAGKLDDYTAESMTPGYNIFRLDYTAEDRIVLRVPDSRKLEELAEQGKVSVTRARGRNIAEDVPYDYVTITGGDLNELLENPEAKKSSRSEGVVFVKAKNSFWNQK